MSIFKPIIQGLAYIGLVSFSIFQTAQATPGCVPGISSTAAISTAGTNVYCVTDYGNSDTWYPGNPPGGYNGGADYLSGDDSPFLSFDGIQQYTPTNFLGHIMDAGTLNPSYNTGSAWQTVTPVAVDGQPTVSSVIKLNVGVGTLDLTVNTTANPNGSVHQVFTLVNNSGLDLQNLTFGDYFNTHPYGSAGGQHNGTTYFDGTDTIWTKGNPLFPTGYIGDSNMALSLFGTKVLPTAWDVIKCTGSGNTPPCLTAINAVNTLTFNNNSGPLTGDVVGLLAYNAGVLQNGQTIVFDIEKNFFPAPEPTTLSLMLLAIPLLRRSNQYV